MADIFEVPQPCNDLLEKANKVRLASIEISPVSYTHLRAHETQ